MPDSKKKKHIEPVDQTLMIFALLPTALIILTLFARHFDAPFVIQISLFIITSVVFFSVLLRLYRSTMQSVYSRQLAGTRAHILLHLIPLIFFIVYQSSISSAWVNLGLVILLILFFVSGRSAWRTLGNLFPSTKLYKIFYRGNSTFMVSLGILYLANLVTPNLVRFGIIEKVALSYFAIHFIVLGGSCLKINADIQSKAHS